MISRMQFTAVRSKVYSHPMTHSDTESQDPDALVRAIRYDTQIWEGAADYSDRERNAAERVTASFALLDAHLSMGGYLPEMWRRPYPQRDPADIAPKFMSPDQGSPQVPVPRITSVPPAYRAREQAFQTYWDGQSEIHPESTPYTDRDIAHEAFCSAWEIAEHDPRADAPSDIRWQDGQDPDAWVKLATMDEIQKSLQEAIQGTGLLTERELRAILDGVGVSLRGRPGRITFTTDEVSTIGASPGNEPGNEPQEQHGSRAWTSAVEESTEDPLASLRRRLHGPDSPDQAEKWKEIYQQPDLRQAEQIVTETGIPIELWRDTPTRPFTWGLLRSKAEEIARFRKPTPFTLLSDSPPHREERTVSFYRLEEGSVTAIDPGNQIISRVPLPCR